MANEPFLLFCFLDIELDKSFIDQSHIENCQDHPKNDQRDRSCDQESETNCYLMAGSILLLLKDTNQKLQIISNLS